MYNAGLNYDKSIWGEDVDVSNLRDGLIDDQCGNLSRFLEARGYVLRSNKF